MRLFILLMCMVLSLGAKEINATYKVSFGIFGKIGKANARLVINENNHYKITMQAKTSGLARALSGSRDELYVSEGIVLENGMLRPDVYWRKVSRKYKQPFSDADENGNWLQRKVRKVDTKRYVFDHVNREVSMERTKEKNKEKRVEKPRKIDYYADNDLLTLFFNFKAMSENFAIKKPVKYYAVGANKTDGRVDIIPPNTKELNTLQKLMKTKIGHFFITFINQKIFASEKGELFVNLNDEGICQKAVLKNVLLFGDIRGELIEFTSK